MAVEPFTDGIPIYVAATVASAGMGVAGLIIRTLWAEVKHEREKSDANLKVYIENTVNTAHMLRELTEWIKGSQPRTRSG